ncbi:MAG TPA: DUF6077 domain-containing protein [Lachnospiraceae bacterium]|nr:DUF6077 domain-containing protein [Lachnospiraceae bacterium]
MLLVQILIFIFLTLILPVLVGAGSSAFLEKQRKNIVFMWMAGYLLLFGVFQLIAVPFILLKFLFTSLVWVYLAISLIMGAAGTLIWWYRKRKYPVFSQVRVKMDRSEKILWIIFGVILLIQLILAVFLAFGDGDDAYYVAVSTTTDSFDTMYRFSPYSGSSTSFDIRHSLAPFPIYIAFLSKVSGLHAGAVSHVGIQLILIPLTYCIYGLIGSRVWKGKRKYLAVFLIFAELLILWGNYSLYTAETFLMTRTRQGKSALGNIVIPAMFLLLYMIGERLAENRKVEKGLWVLVLATVTTSCLCSALGGFLMFVLLGLFILCMICAYKKWKILLPSIICLIPAVVYLGLYVFLA